MIYDEYGNVIKEMYYKVNPEDPDYMIWEINKDLGYACVENIYEGNALVGTKYYDAEGYYIISPKDGYAIYECEYDDMWNVNYEAYYDEKEELIKENIY